MLRTRAVRIAEMAMFVSRSTGMPLLDCGASQEPDSAMTSQTLFEQLQAKVSEVLSRSPAQDVEKNLKAMLSAFFARLDLVTREEFDIQRQVLLRTREKLERLEAKLAEIEQRDRVATRSRTNRSFRAPDGVAQKASLCARCPFP